MSEQTFSSAGVCTHSVCTMGVCVSKSAPKLKGGESRKHGSARRATNTAERVSTHSRSGRFLLLLLLLLCAKLHTLTYVSCHECVQSVCTLEVAE